MLFGYRISNHNWNTFFVDKEFEVFNFNIIVFFVASYLRTQCFVDLCFIYDLCFGIKDKLFSSIHNLEMGELCIFLVTSLVFTAEDLSFVLRILILSHSGVWRCGMWWGAHLGLLLTVTLCPPLLDVDRMLAGYHAPWFR